MKFGIIILSRFDSTRLPGKALRKIRGKELLLRIYEKLTSEIGEAPVIIATSERKSDDPIADFCARNQIECFRGNLADVSKRFLDCAVQYDLDFAIRINGDNLFVAPEIVLTMMEIAEKGDYDLVTNVPGRTFPYGMSIEIININFYKQFYPGMPDEDREHVTSYIYKKINRVNAFVFENKTLERAKGIRLAIDTLDDVRTAEDILDYLESEKLPENLKNVANAFHECHRT